MLTLEQMGIQVLEKMDKYPPWAELPEEIRGPWGPYLRFAPVVLASQLREPTSLFHIFKSKLAWIRFLKERQVIQNLYGRTATTVEKTFAEDFSIMSLAANAEAAIKKLEEYEAAFTLAAFLQDSATPERLLLSFIGLSEDLLRTYDSGKLTIEGLLLLQPGVILYI